MTGALAAAAGTYQPLVDISNATATAAGTVSDYAQYELNSSGVGSTGTFSPTTWTWLRAGNASDYQVRATFVTGETLNSATPALGTWQTLSTTAAWRLNNRIAGTDTMQTELLVEIRLSGSGLVVDSASITLEAYQLGS
jgi:hypothetical protein